jgi:hypothetical protein
VRRETSYCLHIVDFSRYFYDFGVAERGRPMIEECVHVSARAGGLVGLLTVRRRSRAPPAKQAKPRRSRRQEGKPIDAKAGAPRRPRPAAGSRRCSASSATGAPIRRTGGKQICYALAKPSSQATEPANRPRDPAYIFVSTRPGRRTVRNEVSIVIGYPFKPGSEATADIGSAKYAMYTQDDGAWVKNAAEEARMVDAMRKGSDIVVAGESGKGTKSTDRYTLKGTGAGARPHRAGVQIGCNPGHHGPTCGVMTTILQNQQGAARLRREDRARTLSGATKPSLVGLARAALADALGTIGVPQTQRKMRVPQLWNWIYVRGVARLRRDDQRVEGAARGARRTRFTLERPEVVAEQFSVRLARASGCCGFRASTAASARTRSSASTSRNRARRRLCVSSQVGCTLTCSFCHTGTQRPGAQPHAGEIVGR